MTKLLGFLVVVCSIAAACGFSDTIITFPELTTTAPELVADPGIVDDPGAEPARTTTTAPEPVPDRLPADREAPAADWVAGINAAGWDFHRHLKGNAVSSPMSIGMAFSLSRAGASPDSGSALDEIFGFPRVGVHKAANAVDLSLAEASVGPTTLEVANRLFPDDGFSMLDDFVHTAAAQYGAVVQPVDTGDGAAAADTINSWVSQKTRGLIPTIVNERVVQDQELILVNTVYLKADWLWPFLPGRTRDGQFTVGDNQSVTVPFMSDREPVSRRFVRLEDADAVELLYKGSELAMWLIVPHDPTGARSRRGIARRRGTDRTARCRTNRPGRRHHAQVGTDPAACGPVRMALPTGILRRCQLRRHRTRHLHHCRAPRRQSHRRRKGHRSSRSHIHGLPRVHASRTRPHHRRRPAIPVGHHPPRHRCPAVRRPPRRPNRVEQTARPHSTARLESSNP